MLRFALCAILILSAAHAGAAERTTGVGSFDRVRIEGVFDVRIATGRSPAATVSGDARAIEQVELRVEGGTLTLRRRGRDAAGVRATTLIPIVVMLATPALRTATIVGAATVTVNGMKTERADLSVAGPGTLTVNGLLTEQTHASVVGGGRIALAGQAGSARLSAVGGGTIDAVGLTTGDLAVRLDGPGHITAQARYLATVSSSGLGRVTVTGNAKCTIRAPTGSPVSCGKR